LGWRVASVRGALNLNLNLKLGFEEKWGFPPSPSVAGLACDGTNMFIQIAEYALAEYGELSGQTIYKWAKENLQTRVCLIPTAS
jgi:hypothetical protein